MRRSPVARRLNDVESQLCRYHNYNRYRHFGTILNSTTKFWFNVALGLGSAQGPMAAAAPAAAAAPRPFVIGLTGGIASGKSTLAATIAERLGAAHGGELLDCDKLGHQAYNPAAGAAGAATRDALEAEFGAEAAGGTLLAEDGTVDRAKLGPIVFGDQARMEALNGIVWPAIAALAELELRAAAKRGCEAVCMEAAVLLEAGWEAMVDEVWVVYCPPEVSAERLCARNGFSREEAAKRLARQMPTEARLAKADVVLLNDRSPAAGAAAALAACAELDERLRE